MEIVFIDPAVPDLEILLNGVRPGVRAVLLRADQDAITQITDVLSTCRDLAAVHLVSHGAPGRLVFSSGQVDAAQLRTRSGAIAGWRDALRVDAELLLYGCDVASNLAGSEFIHALAQGSGIAVRASADRTGSSRLCGNWRMEAHAGRAAAATELAFAPDVLSEFAGILAAFTDNCSAYPGGSTATSFTTDLGGVNFTYTFGTDGETGQFTIDPSNGSGDPASASLNLESSVPGAGNEIVTIARTDGAPFLFKSLFVFYLSGETRGLAIPVVVEGRLGGVPVGSSQSAFDGNSAPLTFNLIVDEVRITCADFLGVNIDDFSGDTNVPPFTRDITSFLQLGANAGAQSAAGTYATAQLDNVTLETWVYLSTTTGAHHVLINGHGGLNGYGLFLQDGGKVSVLMGNEGWVWETGSSMVAGRWTHLAAVRNSGGGGTLGWKIYVDGQEKATVQNAITGDGVPNALDGSSYVQIGSAAGDPTGLSVSEARIWTRALTQAEVQSNMFSTVATNGTGLVGYWRLANGTGSTATDLQTNQAALNLPISGTATWIASTSGSTAEDTALVGQLAGGDLETSVTYAKASDPAHGAVVVGASGSYTYTPTANYNGPDSFTFRVNDGSADSASRTVNLTITAANDGPTIGGAVAAQTVNDTGTLTLFSTLTIADVDSATVTASVTLDTAAKGVFTPASLTASGFSTADGGLIYTHAAASPADMQTAIRQLVFDPANNRVAVGATETTTFTVSVDDAVAAPVTNNTTTVVATSVNDAPTLAGGPYALATTNEDTTSSGTLVSAILGGLTYADVDGGAASGIAVVASTGNGTWQYSTDAITWNTVGAVAGNSALLLSGSTTLRYVPDGASGETASLTFRAWDQTSGTASTNDTRTLADSTTNGGATAFSSGTAQASLTVTAVNDAPTLTTVSALGGGLEDVALTISYATLAAAADEADVDSGALSFRIESVTTGALTKGGTPVIEGATLLSTGEQLVWTPAANAFGTLNAFTVRVWDGALASSTAVQVQGAVAAVADTPNVSNATTVEETQTTSGLVISCNAADGAEITHFKITAISNGTLYLNDGTTAVAGGSFITFAQANAGLKFTPAVNKDSGSGDSFSFAVQGATSAGDTGLSATASAAITVTGINDAPVVTASGGTTAYTEGNNTTVTVVVDGTLTVADVDSATLATATVTISGGFQAGQDALAFTNTGSMGNIAGSYDGGSGVLTLSSAGATATVAEWQAALRAVTYTNTADSPNTSSRTISFVANDGALDSAASTKAVSVAATNDSPVVTTTGGTTTFTEGNNVASAPVAVDAGLTVNDADHATLGAGSVIISANYAAGDVLAFTNNNAATFGNITPAAWDAANGALSLSSAGALATKAQWQNALRAVTFSNPSENPSALTRTITFTVNDGAGGSILASKAVAVVNVNDTPTDIGLSSSSVNQSAGVNGVVGTLSASDLDDAAFTFTLVAGDGTNDAANSSFNISGTSLRANNAGLLAAGVNAYAVRVQVSDGHGGTYAESFTITVIDNVAPAKPAAPDLDPTSDTGMSTTDNLTTDTTPTFSGTAEAGSTVTLYDTDGTTVLGTATATGGNWSITSSVLGAGPHTVTVKAKDAVDNVSPASDGLVVTIDTSAPTVTSVGVPANATYFAGQNLEFTINWDEAVAVNTTGGTPSLAVTVGAATRQATYQSGSSTNALVFRYTTQSGDLDSDGITVGALGLNGGAIVDVAGNTATLTLNSVGSTASVLVDAEAPTVTGRTLPANGTYKTGQNLDFTVTYSENVTVNTGGGTPYIAVTLDTGGSVQAAYNGGTGTQTLTFRYTVVSGNLDTDGIAVASAITLGGGTIRDAIGNNAQVTALGFGDTTGVLVDGVVPTVSTSNRQMPAAATTKGPSVVYRVTFNEPVTGVNATDFTLTRTGTADGTITSVSPVTGSETTVYDVVVNSVSGNGTLRLDLKNAGTGIADLATNAIATGYTSGQTYTIDSIAPTLGAIARQTLATVNTSAATATWRVSFSEGVTGVDAGDFVLTAPAGSGSTATGVIASVTGVVGSETMIYDVVVNVSGQGQARLDLKATGTGIADLGGNALADGGFTAGDFYLVGITNVFDTLGLLPGTSRLVQGSTRNKVAQRFTTGATAPLSLTTVAARLGLIAGTPIPVVSVYTDNADPVGGTLVATLTNPASLSANALNVWTSTQLLTASTTYWLVFEDVSAAGSYEIAFSGVTTGGVGAWLTTYAYAHGIDFATNPQAGSLRIAIGATSTPTITSALTASGSVGDPFSYTVTATNTPTSYAATGLPSGLHLNTTTGAITGTPSQAGTFNVSLTGTNASGTGPAATLTLTIGQGSATVTLGSLTQSYTGTPRSVTATTSPSGLSLTILYAGSLQAPTAVGSYNVLATVDDPDYVGTASGTLTISPAAATVVLGGLSQVYDGTTKTATVATSPAGLAVTVTYNGGATAPTAVGSYAVVATITQPGYVGSVSATLVITPAVTLPPIITPGETVTLTASDSGLGSSGRWQRNGADLPDITGLTLTLPDVQPPTAGLYTYTGTTTGGGFITSDPVIVGMTTTDKVIGTGEEVGTDIRHPNGNTYDQLLLEGKGATLTADPTQVTRISFCDLSGDIVQVEYFGAGTLSLVMDDASTPAPAANYNQPSVEYVKGHVGIVITGANETSNLSVFSVGSVTAINQSLLRGDVDYDGVANIAFVAIQSTNGKFGGIRTGNVEYFAARGFTGIYAPGVAVLGPVYVGDIQAYDDACPLLILGDASDVRITGGSLLQPNGRVIKVNGITQLHFTDGVTSHGVALPAQTNRGVLEQEGADVTDVIVVNP